MSLNDLQRLTDDELVARIASLDGAAKEATGLLVAHLAELEARDLHLALGFKSLYQYCRAVLHLSEHESYTRMEAAHVARRFPVVVPMLAEGLLHLTAVRLLAPHLQDENHLALLGGAIHKSKAEVKELLARWFPKAAVATSIRRVATKTAEPAATRDVVTNAEGGEGVAVFSSTAPPTDDGPTDERAADEGSTRTTANRDPGPPVVTSPSSASAPARRRATIDALSADSYAVRLTARRATIERLRRAQEILSHAVPDGDVDEVLYRVLGEFIEREGKSAANPVRQRTRTARPTARPSDPASRTVSAEVERSVRRRDQDRCAFVAKGGRRCEERRFLELHT